MSEQLGVTLTAAATGKTARLDGSGAHSPSESRDAARRDGFDGFLKSFLEPGRSARADAPAHSPASGAAGRKAPGRRDAENSAVERSESDPARRDGHEQGGVWHDSPAQAASRLPAKERNGLRQALKKTRPSESVADETPAPALASPAAIQAEMTPAAEEPLAETAVATDAAGEPLPQPEASATALPGVSAPAEKPGADAAAGRAEAPPYPAGTAADSPSLPNSQAAGAPGAALPAAQPVDPQVAAAAEEAARLIWSIIYPEGGAPAKAETPDSLQQLAALFLGRRQSGGDAGLANLGGANVSREALAQALDTSNASAEMNIDAVLSTLNELLDGMPRSVLDQALQKTAQEMGLGEGLEGADLFNEIAVALGMEVIEPEASGAERGRLWVELERNAARQDWPGIAAPEAVISDERGKAEAVVAGTAENAGENAADAEIYGWLEQILEEQVTEFSAGEAISAEEFLTPERIDEFARKISEYLSENGNHKQIKELTKDPARLGEALRRVLTGGGEGARPESGEIATIDATAEKIITKLESLLLLSPESNTTRQPGESGSLHGLAGGGMTAGAGISPNGLSGETRGEGATVPNQPATTAPLAAPEAAPAQANAPAAKSEAGSMGTMLDRIENLERLADAVKMANKGGLKHITMALSPPELGKVMLRIEARDGVVSAYLKVEKPEAVSQLTSGLAQLRENLKAQGIELGELDIRQQHQGQGAENGDQRQKRSRETDPDDDSPRRRFSGIEGSDDAEDVEPTAGATGSSTVNLFA